MKSSNFRQGRLNAGMQMLAQLFQRKMETARINRLERQERRKRRWGSYAGSGCGPRERARRIKQMANFMDCGQYNFRTAQQ